LQRAVAEGRLLNERFVPGKLRPHVSLWKERGKFLVKLRVPSNDDRNASGHGFFHIPRSHAGLQARLCARGGKKNESRRQAVGAGWSKTCQFVASGDSSFMTGSDGLLTLSASVSRTERIRGAVVYAQAADHNSATDAGHTTRAHCGKGKSHPRAASGTKET
jgi:hypothetical protein